MVSDDSPHFPDSNCQHLSPHLCSAVKGLYDRCPAQYKPRRSGRIFWNGLGTKGLTLALFMAQGAGLSNFAASLLRHKC